MLEELKKKVFEANLKLVENGLVIYTWGNVSAIDRNSGLIVIKPSGVDYEKMSASDMVVVDLQGNIVEGKLKPSSDTPTHLEIYKKYPSVNSVVHTHSTFATSFAQAGRNIECFGTTHADYFYGPIVCARSLKENEIKEDYEKNTGLVICETIKDKNPLASPAILVKSHGVFAFGKDTDASVMNATVCEQVAKMAYLSLSLSPKLEEADKFLQDKHYFRKHGKNAYYGQK